MSIFSRFRRIGAQKTGVQGADSHELVAKPNPASNPALKLESKQPPAPQPNAKPLVEQLQNPQLAKINEILDRFSARTLYTQDAVEILTEILNDPQYTKFTEIILDFSSGKIGKDEAAARLSDRSQDQQSIKVRETMSGLLVGNVSKDEAAEQLRDMEAGSPLLRMMHAHSFSFSKSKYGVTILAAIEPIEGTHKYVMASDSDGNLYLAIQPQSWCDKHKYLLHGMEELLGKKLKSGGSKYKAIHKFTSAEADKFDEWLSTLSDSQKTKVDAIKENSALLVEAEGKVFLVLLDKGIRYVALLEHGTGGGAISFEFPKSIDYNDPASNSLFTGTRAHDFSHDFGQGPNVLVALILLESLFAGKEVRVGLSEKGVEYPEFETRSGRSYTDYMFMNCELAQR